MPVDASYNTLNYRQQGGAVDVIGGELRIASGGKLTANGTQAGPTATITDNTGGTASATLAAITAGASYSQADMQAVQNALASLAAQYNALLAILKGIQATT